MTERAPDLAGPIIGWRVWRIAVDGELVSAYTPAGWPGRAPIVARCYERPGAHDAPDEQCVCGVYACEEANAALFYAHRSGSAVVGRTRLWGRVVEHEAGWRAERSYPDAIYVPREHFDGSAETVAAHLAHRYGVPVHVVDELRSVIAQPEHSAVTSRDVPMPELPEWVARRVRPQPLADAREAAAATTAAGAEPSPPPSGGNGLLRRLLGRRG
jgi:hypothetical protein